MPIITDSRYTGALVGDLRPLPEAPTPPPEPTTLDTLAAAARLTNFAGAAQGRGWFDKSNLIQNLDPEVVDPTPPGFDPLDNVKGYEEFAKQFIHDTSPEQVAQRKRQIDRERADREVLSRSGAFGVGAQLVFGALDPSFLVVAGVPELALFRAGRLARAAQAAGSGAAAASVYEVGMQNLQETRTPLESALSVGGGALIAGVLGALGRSVPKKELDNLVNVTERDTAPRNPDPNSQSFGAASSAKPTTLARESWAGGGAAFAKYDGKFMFETDAQKVMKSQDLLAHQTLQELTDMPGITGGHAAGDAFPTIPAETAIEGHTGKVSEYLAFEKQQFQELRAELKANNQPKMPFKDFVIAVAKAGRRGDVHPLPQVAKSAAFFRAKVFDPMKKLAQGLDEPLLPPDSEISLFAKSYFMRLYDKVAMRNNRAAWDTLIQNHLASKGVEDPISVANALTTHMLGMDSGLANFHIPGTVAKGSPLHGRVLDIPDELVEPFLVNDTGKIAAAYVRSMAPPIEIAKRFGDIHMSARIEAIETRYATRKAAALGTPGYDKAAALIDREAQDTLQAIARMRDRLYGRAGVMGSPAGVDQGRVVAAAQGWRNIVGGAKMGGVAATGGAGDLLRVTAEHSFAPMIASLTKLVANPEFRRAAFANARRLGVANEVAMKNRYIIATDGASSEGWTGRIAETVYKISGLNHMTDFTRTLGAVLVEDKILSTAAKMAAGKAIDKLTLVKLARLGLGETELHGIAAQAAQHGTKDVIRTSGSLHWTDGNLAQRYDAAILRDSMNTTLRPGVSDRSWLLDGELGKTLFQIKSFAIASPLRYTMNAVQLAGLGYWGAAARYTGYMMAGGYMAHVFRQLLAGKEPITSPGSAAAEAWNESGMGGLTGDFVTLAARRFGWFGESARYSDRNAFSALGGPSVGALADFYDVAYNRTQGGISANDLQAIRRLIPFQNLWYLRRLINALQGEAAEAMDLQGADHLSFADRLTQTTPLPIATQRGGTGTGLPAQ